jgi:AcrR family transcriptional regulator
MTQQAAGSRSDPHRPAPRATGLRDRARRAVRTEVAAVALELFARQGFDNTTIEQIAAAAGLSRSSFFRYFATKEDVVLGGLEERGKTLREALVARPDDEPPWQALRAAFETIVRANTDDRDRALRLATMLAHTPSLRAWHAEKQVRWQALLVPELARRMGHPDDDLGDPVPRAVVAAALACLDAAVQAWRASPDGTDLGGLLDRTMSLADVMHLAPRA